jgi:hypothetical protein
MHNMIIESEREHPVLDTEPYHRQGPLATVDHEVPATFDAFVFMRQEIRDAKLIANYKTIWWSRMLKGNT